MPLGGVGSTVSLLVGVEVGAGGHASVAVCQGLVTAGG